MSQHFRSRLATQFERFVALKRAGGCHYRSQEDLLKGFDRHLVEHAPKAPLRHHDLIDFLTTLDRLSPRGRDNAIDVVWQALAFARLHGARIDSSPRPPRAPNCLRIRQPRLIAHEQRSATIAAARSLPPTHRLRPATYATLYGLLFATGMRIGEALALDVGDLDREAGLLDVRRGKFGKSRVLPLRASTAAALQRYIDDPRRPIERTASAPLFVSGRHRRLAYSIASQTFKERSQAVGISPPMPRLHDIRHSFAVLCVVDSYRAGRDVNALLPALSTYLGHVSVENTRTYLQANALLLNEASQLFCNRSAQLDQVLS